MTSVSIKTTAITDIVIFKKLRLGDQVYHIEAETLNALGLPEPQNILQFLTDFGIFPVQICLSYIEQVQIPFPREGTYSQAGPPNLDAQLVGILSGVPSLKM